MIIAPAPELFIEARTIGGLIPTFSRHGGEGEYWLVDDPRGRMAALLVSGVGVATPAAAVIPLDADFSARANAAALLWRLATAQPQHRTRHRLTLERRRRLALTLRALDGRLAGESYRMIARALFGVARVPAGPGWKTHDLRDRTIRLVRAGLALMQGGYLDLLRYPHRHNRL